MSPVGEVQESAKTQGYDYGECNRPNSEPSLSFPFLNLCSVHLRQIIGSCEVQSRVRFDPDIALSKLDFALISSLSLHCNRSRLNGRENDQNKRTTFVILE